MQQHVRDPHVLIQTYLASLRLERGLSENTVEAYRRDLWQFVDFLEEIGGAPAGFELLCRFFCIPGERGDVEPLARFMFASYATVPVYEAFFRWLGYGERIDEMVSAWAAKDREAAIAAAPWDVIEDTFIFGSPDEMRSRLEAFVDGGITLPILTPITMPDGMSELIDGLAPR